MQVGVIAAAITFMFLNLDSLYRPVANCSLVPFADDGFLEMPARYPTFSVSFDVLERRSFSLLALHEAAARLAAANPHC